MLAGHKADPPPDRRQTLICVINAQIKTKFRTRSEHAVGFIGSLGHEVVDHDTDVRIGTIQHQRFFTLNF